MKNKYCSIGVDHNVGPSAIPSFSALRTSETKQIVCRSIYPPDRVKTDRVYMSFWVDGRTRKLPSRPLPSRMSSLCVLDVFLQNQLQITHVKYAQIKMMKYFTICRQNTIRC